MQRISLRTPYRGLGLPRALYRPPVYRGFAQAPLQPPSPPTPPNPPAPEAKSRRSFLRATFTVAKWTGFLIGSAGVGVLLIGAGVFIHDAFTYSEKHLDRVPVSPLALNPKLGGPKSLPIAEVNLDDEENDGEHEVYMLLRARQLIICSQKTSSFRKNQDSLLLVVDGG